jgi:hypothetical protein
MDAFENRLRDSQGDVSSLVATAPFSNYKHAGLVFEKLTNLVGTQVPHLSNFGNGIVSFSVCGANSADGN